MTPMHEQSEPQAAAFSRRWWLGKAHTVFWVVLATLLIWIYADMEFTDEMKFRANLSLTTGNSQNVALLGESQFDLYFTLSGSKTALLQFRQELVKKGALLNYDVSQEYAPGINTVPTTTLLEKTANLAQHGITIKDVQPQVIPIHLDRLKIIPNVPVTLDAHGATFNVKGDLPKVKLSVAESRWKIIQDQLKGQPPRLRTVPVDLRELSPDKPVVAEINPVLEGQAVTLEPDAVSFDVEVISSRTTEKMWISVKLLCPREWSEKGDTTWQKFIFVPNEPNTKWRPLFVIEGEPKDLKTENVKAYVELTDDDKKATEAWLTRDVVVSFPPGSNLKLVGNPPQVQFRLEKR